MFLVFRNEISLLLSNYYYIRTTMEIRDCNPFFVLSFVYYVSGKNSLYHVCLMYVHVWCFFDVVIYYAEINLSKNLNAICFSARTRRFSPVAVRLIKHRPVPGRASDDLLRDIWKFPALVRHRTIPDRAPYGARTGTVRIVRYNF